MQKAFDDPYSDLPAPSKIPGGALEFDVTSLGEVKNVELDIETATCIVEWKNGARLTTFVHATEPIGWYKFENISSPIKISLVSPAYNRENKEAATSQSRNDLNQLGYEQGKIEKNSNSITYNQKGWGKFAYQISTQWEETNTSLIGTWSISSENSGWEMTPKAKDLVLKEIVSGMKASYDSHVDWWLKYWSKSSVNIPDSLLQKQYYLEMYKFGSAARSDTPPISLQAVWTADHGKLPPWKGDFHHDLNTQLSYWPAYTGNYLNLEEGFVNWLWKYRHVFKKYTKDFFGVDGMNVPGVTTLEGEPMGGWAQYSFSPTVASWLGHHFYMHWVYSMDRDFLKERAYPWLKDIAIYLDQISQKTDTGKRKLPISSSPEIRDNSRDAWFSETTNYDLALIRWTYEKATELALELGLEDEANNWKLILSEWPDFAIDENTGLKFAPDLPYEESHRHFSHLMAYHPLELIDFSKGETDKQIIQKTLKNLEDNGTDYWTGYSFSWQANLYARAFKGKKAAEALRIFAECFCLKNSFHANGDQCKAGHSNFTYRPFTLEGNFAFASAIQEMLMQSHTGVVKVFPAIPSDWKDVGFEKLRARGAFLVSAAMQNGLVNEVEIYSEKGGKFVLSNPFENLKFESSKKSITSNELIIIEFIKGERVILKAQNNLK